MADVSSYRSRATASARVHSPQYPTATSDMFSEVKGLIDEQLDKSIVERATAEGVSDQQNSNGNLVQSEGFLGFQGLRSQAYNRGAKAQFRVQKEGEARTAIRDMEQANMLNPEGFKKDFDKFRSKFMDNVPLDLQPAFQGYVEQQGQRTLFAIEDEKYRVDRNEQRATILRSADEDLDEISNIIEQNGADPTDDAVADRLFELQASRQQKLADLMEAGLITQDDYEKQTQADYTNYLFLDTVAEAERLKRNGGDVKQFIRDLDNPDTTPEKLKGLTRSQRETFQAKINTWFEDESSASRADIARSKRDVTRAVNQIYNGSSPADLEAIRQRAEAFTPELVEEIDIAIRNYSKSVDFNKSGFEEKIARYERLEERLQNATTEEFVELEPLRNHYREAIKEHAKAIKDREGLAYAEKAGMLIPDINFADPATFTPYIDSVNQAQDKLGTEVVIEGGIRPFREGEAISNPDGTYSTEVTMTVTHPDLNGGKPTVIPSLYKRDGKTVDLRGNEDGAVKAAIESGLSYPSFENIPDADKFAQDRSNQGGIGSGPLGQRIKIKDSSLGLFTHPKVKAQFKAQWDNSNLDQRLVLAKNIGAIVKEQGGDFEQSLKDLGISDNGTVEAFYMMSGEPTYGQTVVAKKILQGVQNEKYEIIKNATGMKRLINDEVQKVLPVLTDGFTPDQNNEMASEARDAVAAIVIANRLGKGAEITSFDDDVTETEIQTAFAQYLGLDTVEDFPQFNGVTVPPIRFGISGDDWENQFSTFSDAAINQALNGAVITDGTGREIPLDRIRNEGVPFPVNDNGDFIILMKDPTGQMFAVSRSVNGAITGQVQFSYSDVPAYTGPTTRTTPGQFGAR